MAGQITISGSNMDIRIEWKISHFFKRIDKILSAGFRVFNTTCALQLKPKEHGFVRMNLLNCSGSEIIGECIMGIKKADGSETRTEKMEFLLSNCKTTDSLKLISVNDLLSSRDTMAPDDCLTVFCNVHLTEVLSDDPVVNILNPPLSGIEEKKAAHSLSPNASFQKEKGIATSGDSGVNEAISVLTENLKNLYLKKSNTDAIIKVKNKEFSVHKLILGARSEVFAAMFEHDTFERRSGIIEITDCDPDSFEDFLLFLYTADVKIVSSRNAVGLYKTSDKYGCKELLKECVRCMVQELSVDTFFDYFPLATMHNESDLLTAVTNFFIKNAKTIFSTTKWLDLMQEHPSLCNELLIKFANTV